MPRRTHAHDLPESFKSILFEMLAGAAPPSKLDLSRTYGGGAIDQLLRQGHLAEALIANDEKVIVTPLTIAELSGFRPWHVPERQYLMRHWPTGTPIQDIARTLSRSGGEIVSQAWQLGLIRGTPRRRRASGLGIPAWRVKRNRLRIIEAERRGLNWRDNGEELEHRAMFRRFLNARSLVTEGSPMFAKGWQEAELSILRNLRDRGWSIHRIASQMQRTNGEIAERLLLIGRRVSGEWQEAEDATIAEGLSNGLSFRMIATKLPGRTHQGVQSRVRYLKGIFAKRPWSEIEINQLIDGVLNGLRWKELTTCVPSRGHQAARRHLYKITHQNRDQIPWSEHDFNILYRAERRGETPENIALWLGRNLDEVKRLAAYFHRTGKKAGRISKISPEMMPEVRARLAEPGATKDSVAAHYGVCRAVIHRALQRHPE